MTELCEDYDLDHADLINTVEGGRGEGDGAALGQQGEEHQLGWDSFILGHQLQLLPFQLNNFTLEICKQKAQCQLTRPYISFKKDMNADQRPDLESARRR